MANYAIVTDLNRCTGCLACTVACKAINGVDVGSFWIKTLRVGPHPIEGGSGTFPDVEMYFLPVQANGAAVGGKNAAQNIHQGRFAGTVFSQQRTDFPGSQGKVHIPQYTVRPEGFVDFLH